MTTPVLQIEHRGAVSEIRLCREEAHNALDTALLQALDDAIADVTGRPATRALIVSGQRVFCSGADLEHLATQSPEQVRAFCALGTGVLDRLASAPILTIAAVGGAALGGGFELVLACDMAVATPGALFGLPEIQLGAIPSFGGVRRLCRRLPPSTARELVYSGRTLTAARAKELGLVLDVVKPTDLVEHCATLASRIARNAPLALAAAKRLFVADELGDGSVERELAEAQQLVSTADWHEGLTARRNKRRP
ncbi:MAG TPA: enoyl-CoA hydratase/isomerase family protein [Kofleriaceae bacterium]